MAVTLYAFILLSSLLAAVQGSTNLARHRPSRQSSTAFHGGSARAVDGRTSTNYFHHSCTHTKLQDRPYWSVDLGRNIYIHEVKITNRGDCCGARLRNFDIYIGDGKNFRSVGHVAHVQSGATISVKTGCNKPQGRYLVVRLRNRGILTLCEVQVFGSQYISRNLALRKRTMQSSTAYGGVSSRAVDGKPYANWNQRSCTHTRHQPRAGWVVDLGASYYIHNVRILNRGDCCASRLQNFDIRLAYKDYRYIENYHLIAHRQAALPGGRKTNIATCSNIRGRYLMIALRGNNFLTLCEVEVFGSQ